MLLKSRRKREAYQTYLENRILNKNELEYSNQNIKTSEAIQGLYGKQTLNAKRL